MASNGQRGMMRPATAGRSPSFIIVGLVVVIGVIGFNYWSISSQNSELQSVINDMTEKMRAANSGRLSSEKRNLDLDNQLKISASSVGKKEQELSNLRQKMSEKEIEIDQRRNDLRLLDECKANLDDISKNISGSSFELSRLKVEIQSVRDELQQEKASKTSIPKSDCGFLVNETRVRILQIVQQTFGQKGIIYLKQAGIDTSGIGQRNDGGQSGLVNSQGEMQGQNQVQNQGQLQGQNQAQDQGQLNPGQDQGQPQLGQPQPGQVQGSNQLGQPQPGQVQGQNQPGQGQLQPEGQVQPGNQQNQPAQQDQQGALPQSIPGGLSVKTEEQQVGPVAQHALPTLNVTKSKDTAHDNRKSLLETLRYSSKHGDGQVDEGGDRRDSVHGAGSSRLMQQNRGQVDNPQELSKQGDEANAVDDDYENEDEDEGPPAAKDELDEEEEEEETANLKLRDALKNPGFDVQKRNGPVYNINTGLVHEQENKIEGRLTADLDDHR